MGDPWVEVEDRLRAGLRELDAIPLAPYGALRERAAKRASRPASLAVLAVAVALIVVGAIAGEWLRDSRHAATGSSTATSGDCGAQTSQIDSMGRLVGLTNDSTTILVGTFSAPAPQAETFFFWHMTSPRVTPLSVWAQLGNEPQVAPTSIETVGPDDFVVRITFANAGCWRLHSERADGALRGDVWLQVLTDGAIGAPGYTNADCSRLSRHDASGRLLGTTIDSTTILVGTPAEVRPGMDLTFQWHMTSGLLGDPLSVYAQYGDGTRVRPRLIETVGPDDFLVRVTLPIAGCWRLHSERTGGKLSGDVWLQVPPLR